MRGREAGEKKKEGEPLINILIRNESRAVRFVSLTIMIFRDNAAADTKFRMSNNTRLYEKDHGTRTGYARENCVNCALMRTCESLSGTNNIVCSKRCNML